MSEPLLYIHIVLRTALEYRKPKMKTVEMAVCDSGGMSISSSNNNGGYSASSDRTTATGKYGLINKEYEKRIGERNRRKTVQCVYTRCCCYFIYIFRWLYNCYCVANKRHTQIQCTQCTRTSTNTVYY